MIGTLFIYTVKVSICQLGFYLFYKLLLSRDTFYRFNRLTLLGLILLSLLLPLVQVSVPESSLVAGGRVDFDTLLLMAVPDVAPEDSQGLSWIQMQLVVYVAGIVFFLGRELRSLWQLRCLMRTAVLRQEYDGIRLRVIDDDIAPFSWMRYVFISRSDYLSHPNEILRHEQAHVLHRHSMDILLCDVLLILFWFNPAAWLLKKELQDVHEYEADEAVLAGGVCMTDYQLLLIRKSVGDRMFVLANNFNRSSLKKRIYMMMTQKSSGWNRAKLLVTVPLAALAVVAFANEKAELITQEVKTESRQLVSAVEQDVKQAVKAAGLTPDKKMTVKVVQDSTETSSLKVPGTKKKILYIVDGKQVDEQVLNGLEGSIDNITVLKGKQATDLYGDKAADGAVVVMTKSGMPASNVEVKSEGGKTVASVKVVNVETKLKNGLKVRTSPRTTVSSNIQTTEDGEKTTITVKCDKETAAGFPLVMIDGKEATKAELEVLDTETIASITVLKGKQATDLYGDKAVNGVIVVEIKK